MQSPVRTPKYLGILYNMLMRSVAPALTLSALLMACGSTPEPEFNPWTLEELTPAAGFSVRIPETVLEPGQESQTCYFMRVPDINNGQPFYISRVHTAINPGSHHFNVFRVRTIVGLDPEAGEDVMIGQYPGKVIRADEKDYHSPCWTSSNWADWPLVSNSQNSKPDDPYTDWQLPQDVAIKFEPGELLMLQPHFVNTNTQKTPYGLKAGLNFHLFPGPAQPIEMGSLFATQQSIRICQSNPTVSFSGTCRFPAGADINISAANGHFHSRGKKFEIYTWDGQTATNPPEPQKFYESDRWDEPPMARGLTAKPPLNGGVWWTCSYQWTNPAVGCDVVNERDKQHAGDCCYTFGAGVDMQEHCNVFLYYYPRVQEDGIFCN